MNDNRQIQISDQLYKLSETQAREVLSTFIKTEREAFPNLKIDSIILDFSHHSVVLALRHIAIEVEAGILNEEQCNIWFMRLGYYLGEALRRTNRKLAWGLGDQEYAFANHPVILGFGNGEEAEVISICRNLVMAVAEGLSHPSRIDNGVAFWFEAATT